MRRTSTAQLRRRPAVLAPLGGQAALELGHHAVHLAQVLRRVGWQRAVELAQRPGGRQRAGALDQQPLELAAHVLLELLEVVARHRVRVGQLRAGRLLALAAQAEAAPDPLHVHADHARALALAAEGHDREPREVAHLAVRAGTDRVADALAQVLEVDALAAA